MSSADGTVAEGRSQRRCRIRSLSALSLEVAGDEIISGALSRCGEFAGHSRPGARRTAIQRRRVAALTAASTVDTMSHGGVRYALPIAAAMVDTTASIPQVGRTTRRLGNQSARECHKQRDQEGGAH